MSQKKLTIIIIIIIIHSRCATLFYYKHEGDDSSDLPDPLDYYKEINIAQVCIINPDCNTLKFLLLNAVEFLGYDYVPRCNLCLVLIHSHQLLLHGQSQKKDGPPVRTLGWTRIAFSNL